ncbi:MAG TPA: hypothetical protein VM686_23530, partial [Polyangiaceae bacterium]|nr:hypothetical protein [Polyangiaceae bacterium]
MPRRGPVAAGVVVLAVAVTAVGIAGYWRIERTAKRETAAHLDATLGAAIAGVREWLESSQGVAELAAGDPRLVNMAACLSAAIPDPASCDARQVESILDPYLRAGDFEDFYLVNLRQGLLAGALHGPARGELPQGLADRLWPLLEAPARPDEPGGERSFHAPLLAPETPVLTMAA